MLKTGLPLLLLSAAFATSSYAQVARPCLNEARSYADEATDPVATGSALIGCFGRLASAGSAGGGTAGGSGGALVLPSAPAPRSPGGPTWMPLPEDILNLLAANGYADYISDGGLLIATPMPMVTPDLSAILGTEFDLVDPSLNRVAPSPENILDAIDAAPAISPGTFDGGGGGMGGGLGGGGLGGGGAGGGFGGGG